jgi:putative addiction module component (TIGR02574 family)
MSPEARQILAEALKLSPIEKAELIEQVMVSFSSRDDKAIDERWAAEAEDRIAAYERGEIKSTPVGEVFACLEQHEVP